MNWLRSRFLRVWIAFAAVYLLFALFGPQGPWRNGHWLQVNQHLVQVRNWLGEGGRHPTLEADPYPEQMVRGSAFWMDLVACPPPAGAQGGRRPFVGFPPGPAFLLLPLRILLRGWLATQWLGAVLGGLAVAALDALFPGWLEETASRDRSAGPSSRNLPPSRNCLTLLAGLGTLWIWLVPNGLVYHFAQTVATASLTLALLAAWRGRFALSGLAFALAITSRPATCLALPFVVWSLRARGGRPPERIAPPDATPPARMPSGRAPVVRWIRFAAAPLLFTLVMLGLNQARFGSPFEFGYRWMQMPELPRFRFNAHGQFSPAFFPDDFRWLILAPPVLARNATGAVAFPWLISHPMGMGVFFVTPAFLAALLTLAPPRLRRRPVQMAWISLALCTIPPLLYYNTGLIQWGGRFLLDAWPFWCLLTASGLSLLPRQAQRVLIGISVLWNVWAAIVTAGGWWPPPNR